jgi:hypothetical protein
LHALLRRVLGKKILVFHIGVLYGPSKLFPILLAAAAHLIPAAMAGQEQAIPLPGCPNKVSALEKRSFVRNCSGISLDHVWKRY